MLIYLIEFYLGNYFFADLVVLADAPARLAAAYRVNEDHEVFNNPLFARVTYAHYTLALIVRQRKDSFNFVQEF